MTGVNINKFRHYAPGFNSRTTRLDADVAALIFKAGNSVISRSDRLIADISVKAAMPTSPDTDGKKRGPENTKSKKYVNLYGVVYDPTATKKEGQYFKHYVTESERIEALRSPEPVPNWGWMDNDAPTNSLPKPRNAVAKVTRYPVNPKTGEPMKTQGFEPEIKALGRTIGEMSPGSKLSARAAMAIGLVIDALGRFRCPAGLFTANRFTNERGEGCFGVSAEQMQDIAGALTNVLQAPNDKITLINSLLAVGVTAAEIRREYRKGGVEGLASLASRAGIRTESLIGDKGATDASYISTATARIREKLKATKNAPARMDAIREKKNRVIQELKDKYGITETDEYTALGLIFKAIGEDPDAPFGPNQFQLLFMGGSPESHEQWVIEAAIKMHAEAIMRKTGLLDEEAILAAYQEAKRNGTSDTITDFIDAAVEREKKFRIGAFKQILVDVSENPETFKTANGSPFEIYVDMRRTGRGDFRELNGMAKPTEIYIGSGPAIQGFKGEIPPGYMDLYEATGGDIDDQWRAITETLSEDEKMKRWGSVYATDFAAEYGNGWEDFGAQTAAHETTHKKQFDAIFEWFKVAYPGVDFESASNGELMGAIHKFLEEASDENIAEAFGISFDELIERRLDALAGVYSQVEQQKALLALKSGDKKDFNHARNLAFLETHAELNANRSVGLIGDDPELDEVLDSFILGPTERDVVPATPSGLIIPGTTPEYDGELIIPGAPPIPGGELIIPGRRPDVPIDAPKPVKPKRPISTEGFTETILPENAGQVIRPSRPGGPRAPRQPRQPAGMFEKNRNGKVPTMIREGRFTNQDIEEHMYGEDGKSGLFGMFRSARNMRIGKGYTATRDRQRKKLLNDLIDTMGVSFEELDAMSTKISNGEKLSPEERQKLMKAVEHLRNGANEFKRKSEEARRRYEERRIRGRTSTTDGYDDVSDFQADLESIQDEIEMYEKLFARVGRGFAPAVHDILTMDDNGPYPNRLGQLPRTPGTYRNDLASVKVSQDSILSPAEIEAIDGVSINPPKQYLGAGSAPQLERDIADSVEMSSAFVRHGLTPPSGSGVPSDDIDRALPAMQGIDKTSLPEDLVVEIEIEIDTDEVGSPGSIYEVPSIHTGEIKNDDQQGLASTFSDIGGNARIGAGVVGRLIGSKTGRKLIEKIGVDPEQADLVQMISEVAIGFSVGGPAGAIIPLARRGGRDVSEKALEIMVERGWIEKSVADKIIKYGLDRIASEGLPDEIIKAAEVTKDALLNEDTKRKALEIGSTLQERSIELTEAARERASEATEAAKEKASQLAGRAKEQTSEIVGRVGDRWKRRKDREEENPFSRDPFGNPIMEEIPSDRGGLASTSESNEPFTRISIQESNQELDEFVSRFEPKKIKSSKVVIRRQEEVFLINNVYKIGNENIIFASPSTFTATDENIKVIEMNPFSITGLDKTSKEGQDLALDWFHARAAIQEDANELKINESGGKIEALLYAGINGDVEAMRLFKELANRGRELAEQIRRNEAAEKAIPESRKKEIASKFPEGRLPTIKDLVAVRQLSFEPKYDKDGNLILENASDYDISVSYEADGTPSKETYRPSRTSTHFTINSVVAFHDKWKPGPNDYVMVIDFEKMLEANPGSLDNLYIEDTFLTPKPGQSLTIPEGFFYVEKIEGDRGEILQRGMEKLGKGKGFEFEIGTGGSDSGTGSPEYQVDALKNIAIEELGIVPGSVHTQHPLYIEKNIDPVIKGETEEMPDIPSIASNISLISENAVLQLASKLGWDDSSDKPVVPSVA